MTYSLSNLHFQAYLLDYLTCFVLLSIKHTKTNKQSYSSVLFIIRCEFIVAYYSVMTKSLTNIHEFYSFVCTKTEAPISCFYFLFVCFVLGCCFLVCVFCCCFLHGGGVAGCFPGFQKRGEKIKVFHYPWCRLRTEALNLALQLQTQRNCGICLHCDCFFLFLCNMFEIQTGKNKILKHMLLELQFWGSVSFGNL